MLLIINDLMLLGTDVFDVEKIYLISLHNFIKNIGGLGKFSTRI